MSNNFLIGLAAVGVGAWWLLRSKPAIAHPVAVGTTLTTGGAGQGTSSYGQFPGLVNAGAAGVITDPGSGSSGTIDNSRVFDVGAQEGALYGIDPATGLPYPDRSMLLDREVMYADGYQQGDGYQYRQVNE